MVISKGGRIITGQGPPERWRPHQMDGVRILAEGAGGTVVTHPAEDKSKDSPATHLAEGQGSPGTAAEDIGHPATSQE